MRRTALLLLAALLLVGCTNDPEPAPATPTPTPSSPAPATPSPTPSPSPAAPTPASPPPASPTPTPPTPTPTPPEPEGTRLVNWSFTLSVGGASLPVGSAPVVAENCVAIPSTTMVRGQANATWGGATPLAGTSLDLVVTGANVNASVSGPSPLTVSWTAVPKGNETLVAMYPTDASAAVSPRISVALDLVLEIPVSEGEAGTPVPRGCSR